MQDTAQMNEFNPFNSSGMYIPGFHMGITGLRDSALSRIVELALELGPSEPQAHGAS